MAINAPRMEGKHLKKYYDGLNHDKDFYQEDDGEGAGGLGLE